MLGTYRATPWTWLISWTPLRKKIYLFFNWRIIALQNFVVFCQTSTQISHRCTYIPSLPSPFPSHPSMLIQSPCLSFLSHVANSHCWSPLSEVCRCLDYCWWIFLLASLFINFIRYERRRLCLASFCYVYSEAMTYFTFICSYTLADYFEILKC